MDKIEKLKELANEEKAKKVSTAFRLHPTTKQSLELIAEIHGKSQAAVLEELIREEVNYLTAQRKNRIKELETLRAVNEKFNDLKPEEDKKRA